MNISWWKTVACLYFCIALSVFTHINCFQWQFYAIIIPVLILSLIDV